MKAALSKMDCLQIHFQELNEKSPYIHTGNILLVNIFLFVSSSFCCYKNLLKTHFHGTAPYNIAPARMARPKPNAVVQKPVDSESTFNKPNRSNDETCTVKIDK